MNNQSANDRQVESMARSGGIHTQGERRMAPSGVRPIITWDHRTRHLRIADKVKLHKYPGGLANTTRWRRDRMVEAWHARVESMDEADRSAVAAVHEALAYAIDAERFLGTFERRDSRGKFPPEEVDEVTVHLMAWLQERGYTITPINQESTRDPD